MYPQPAKPWFTSKAQIIQMIASVVGTIVGAIKGLQDMLHSEYLSLGAVTFYCLVAIVVSSFYALASEIRKARLATKVDGISASELQLTQYEKERKRDEDRAEQRRQAERNAPQILVQDAGTTGIANRLKVINDRGELAIDVRFESFKTMNEHLIRSVPADLPSLRAGESQEIELYAKEAITYTGKPIYDILASGDSSTEDVVCIEYKDDQGHTFAREFALKKEINGSVSWRPGKVVMLK